MPTENLWGELPAPDAVRTPLRILKEQASLLGELTKNVIEARVYPVRGMTAPDFAYRLRIVAPFLDNYTVAVFQMEHGLSLYPVKLTGMAVEGIIECDDERSFKLALKKFLTSELVQKTIGSLLALSRS